MSGARTRRRPVGTLGATSPGSPTLIIGSIPSTALPSSTVNFSWTYTVAAPSGLTGAVWNPGAIAATISNFNSGARTATVTTPAANGTYTLSVTSTGSNTATAVAPHTTVVAPVSNSITLTSVPTAGNTSSTVPITFSYTGTAPSGLTAAWNPGVIAGTVTGFSASGGTGSATISTPSSANTYTLSVTGTGGNTSSATAGNTTVISSPVADSITITSMPTVATLTSNVGFSFSYTGHVPSGMTYSWSGGGGSGTVAGFTASGGSGSGSVTAPSAAGTYTLSVTGTGLNTSSATAPNMTGVSGPSTAFPGQPGNQVGYAAAPGFPGSLTAGNASNINASASFKLFDGGTSPVNINGSNFTFTGCYFGVSTDAATGSQGWANFTSGGHTFNFCTFGPSPSVVGGSFPPQPPGGGGYTNWPSQRGNEDKVGIPWHQGNQYGILTGLPPPAGGLNIQNCDIWGFSNGAMLFSQTNASNPITVNNTWMHDPCLAPPGAHTDVIGDVQSMAGDFVTHFTMTNCTCAGVSSEGLALQLSSDTILNNITVSGNYFDVAASWVLYSGMMNPNVVPTNYVFTNNTFNAQFQPVYGICGDGAYGSILAPRFQISGSGNQWRGNKVLPGTYGNGVSPDSGAPSGNIQLTVTALNQYLWPDMTANSSDWTGAF